MDSKQKAEKRSYTDEEIVELYWQRNEEAITATDKKYRRYLYAIAYNIINENSDCEECLNDTYLNTWNSIPPTRPRVLSAFLSRIMRNVAMDKFRYKAAKSRIPTELIVSLGELEGCIPSETTPDEEVAVREVADVLTEYLRSLPRRSMVIFICRYYYADKVSDIAKMLETSETTVWRELGSIREGLYEEMKKRGLVQ